MTHYYESGDFSFPSVTTIISDCTDKSAPLMQWAVNCAVDYVLAAVLERNDAIETVLIYEDDIRAARTEFREISQTALDVGSQVHAAIEEYFISGKEPKDIDGQALAAFVAFLEWKDEHKVECLKVEHTVYGDCWAGTLDFYGMFNGKPYVIDWKSSKALYPEMRYQIAAYRSCLHDVPFLDAPQGCGILRLDKETGLPQWKDTSKTYKKDLFVYEQMVNLFMARHPRIAKKAGWKNGKV